MKNKILIIPGSFVPANDTVTLLTYKRLKHLNIPIDVLALKRKEDSGIKKELEKDRDFNKFNIEYTTEYENTICINHPLRLPLSLINMYRYVKSAVKKYKEENYKYIFTSSVPGISHICGSAIKKRNKDVIWYASFSDPIKGSPYKKDPNLERRSIFYRIAFNVGSFIYTNNKYEEVAIKNADKLIFICEEQRDFTLNQYPNSDELKKKSIILPLCYIDDWKMYKDLIDYKHKHNHPKQAVHLGRLYGLRTIDTFLEALKELKEEDACLKDKIVFHQYSEIQKEDIAYIKENNLEDVFVVHDKVNYGKAIDIMKNADILVLFDTIMPNAKVQPYLPSKIVEYLLLKKDILGICCDNSPSYRILNEYGYNTVGYTKESIKENIRCLINNEYVHEYDLSELESNNNCLKIEEEK